VSGIVLLVLIGVVAAWLFTGGRKKLRLPTTGKHWIWVIIIVFVVLALVYGAHTSPHSTVGHLRPPAADRPR
jgi:predicted membrane-bound dolichyl-phosphate-mannose-protein mannosyltransferase